LPDNIENKEDKCIVQCDEKSLLVDDAVFAARRLFFQSWVNSNQPDNQLEFALFAHAADQQSRLDLLISFNQPYRVYGISPFMFHRTRP